MRCVLFAMKINDFVFIAKSAVNQTLFGVWINGGTVQFTD